MFERTKITVTTPPTIAGPPKTQTRWGSVIAAEVAKLTMYAMPVLKRLMADTRPLMLIGAREYAIPYACDLSVLRRGCGLPARLTRTWNVDEEF